MSKSLKTLVAELIYCERSLAHKNWTVDETSDASAERVEISFYNKASKKHDELIAAAVALVSARPAFANVTVTKTQSSMRRSALRFERAQ